MVQILVEEKVKFDPVRVREVTEGAIARALRTQHDSSRPMGNVAASNLGEAIRACLVGFHAEVAPVFVRANKWLGQAIAEDEEFGPNRDLHRVTLHWAMALGEWIEAGRHADGLWDSARIYEEAAWHYEKRPWPTSEIIKFGLDDYVAFSFLGGDHEGGWDAGIEMYERWLGAKRVSLRKIMKPREYGYALCLHHAAQQQFDESELFEAGRKMLQANLEANWLGAGQYIRAATWLKIVYGHHDSSMTPLQVLLSAYDNMPNVPRPPFL